MQISFLYRKIFLNYTYVHVYLFVCVCMSASPQQKRNGILPISRPGFWVNYWKTNGMVMNETRYKIADQRTSVAAQ